MPGEDVTAKELRRLLNYDPDTGQFTWRVSGRGGPRGIAIGDVAGCLNLKLGYIIIGIHRKPYYAHRLAWLWMTGKWPREIDHANRCKTDNRWINLRIATHQQNTINCLKSRPLYPDLPVGVYPKRGKFYSRICVNGRDYRLGTFATVVEAHAAYVAARKQIHSEFVPSEVVECNHAG